MAQWTSEDIKEPPSPLLTEGGSDAEYRNSHWRVRWLWAASGANLTLVLLVVWLLRAYSEAWWLGTVFVYMPQWPLLVPAVLLALAALAGRSRSVLLDLAAGCVVLGPMMGLQFAIPDAVPSDGATLSIVSCNVQGFHPNFPALVGEIHSHQPDIVVLQEARGTHPLLTDAFPGWSAVHVREFWVGSRFPVRLVDRCHVEAFDRLTAIKVEVETPDALVTLVNVHPMTARRGLTQLGFRSLLNGEGPRALEQRQSLRHAEMLATRLFLGDVSNPPLVVAGDFNVPTSSSLFQKNWGDLTSAFDTAGRGLGYTAPCRPHRLLPDYLPWIRIDHILTNEAWQVIDCQIGSSNNSDHRLIAATLQVR